MGNGVLVHEWLAERGGSENVFHAMADAFPTADLLCLWNDKDGRFGTRHVRETWLASTPLRHSKLAALPFMIPTWRSQPGDYEWAMVSSHLFAHHVSFPRAARQFKKLVYVHSPARYIWTPELDQRGDNRASRAASKFLRPLDRRFATEADSIAVNSRYVGDRVARYWDRESRVIHPPVEVAKIQSVVDWADMLTPAEHEVLAGLPDTFLLGASRFIPYKRLDQVIETGEAAGVPVVIAGDGPLADALIARARRASVPTTVVARPSTYLLYALYQRCLVYVFPAVEDFGIMPVEAMAAGAPVVGLNYGGCAESTADGTTGALIESFESGEVIAAIDRAASIPRSACVEHARRFSREAFEASLHLWHRQTVGALTASSNIAATKKVDGWAPRAQAW